MKIHLLERDSRRNDSDFRETCGSFSVICNTLEKGLRELGYYADNPNEATHVGFADSLATHFRYTGKKAFQINFQDSINTIPYGALAQKEQNSELQLISINNHTAQLWKKYGFECKVIGPGLDADYWIQSDGKQNDGIIFVFSSFSNFRSGLDLLLRAWEIAFTGNTSVYLVVKNTSDSEILERKIDQINKRCGNIAYLNRRMTFSELRKLYSVARFAPNVYRMSGHGMIIGETAAVNCIPIVGAFNPSLEITKPQFALTLNPTKEVYADEIMPELVNEWGLHNTFNGLKFPERPLAYDYNVEEYAALLKELYSSNNMYQSIATRDAVVAHWDYKKSAQNLVEALR